MFNIKNMGQITFFQSGLGQKQSGIEQTVMEVYNYYYRVFPEIRTQMKFIPNSSNLKKNLLNLYEENCRVLTTANININIGGDHSMALSSISACLNMFGTKTKVIWIDSYTKINSNINSSDNLNKMPLSFLTKLNDSNNYEWIKNKLKFENLCLIGIREFEPDEINIIKTFNIKTININQFNTNIIQVLKDLILWAGVAPIHISLNINSLDSKFIQCINLDSDEKTSGKIEIEPLIKFINTFCKFTNVLNVDIAELNLNNPDCGCVNKCEKTKSFEYFNKILKSFCLNM